ncbi:MAG: glycosyltransferase family 2 protein [Faecousia sp.]
MTEEREMPVVTVIVPVYNVEAYLPACIESILNQTYRALQLILVDDGSPDGCGAICDAYAERDDRILVIHKENGGVSNARNAALDQIAGDYFTFCDSDDRYTETWIAELVTALEQENADLAIGNFVQVFADGSRGSSSQHDTGVHVFSSAEDRVDYCIRQMLGYRHGYECCMRLFRREILRNNNIRFCETCQNYAEDMGFSLEYTLCANKVVSTDSTGYLYTIREGSMMHGSPNQVKLDALNEVSHQVGTRLQRIFDDRQAKRFLPVLHYAIMDTEYQRLIFGDYPDPAKAFDQIQNTTWWRHNTRGIFVRWKDLKRICNVYVMRSALVLSYCFLFRDWRMFAFWRNRIRNSE